MKAAGPLPDTPPALDPEALLAQAAQENFSVASVVLPRAVRGHLMAIYGYARLVDDVGDELAGDRLAALDWLEEDLDRAYAGCARHPLLARLTPTLRECALPRAALVRLIEANRVDQRTTRYATFAELEAYCHLSADPVGELVLTVLGLATPERIALSDRVCTALQLAEHLQDVAEDLGKGRVYLPLDDLARFDVGDEDLRRAPAPPSVRELIAFEVGRARSLLRAGTPLLGTLRGRPRLAIAAYVGGGEAALAAIEAAGHDVSAGPPRAGRAARVRAAWRALREGRPR
jgi:squalene synthase HpnC